MEEKVLSEKESFELIASMIRNTKKKLERGSGNLLMAWGYLIVAVALTVGCGLYFSENLNWLWGWFVIPAIGWPMHWLLARKKNASAQVKTVVDRYIGNIWAVVGVFFGVMMLVCLAFGLAGYYGWGAMYLLTLPCCGFATVATGVILREVSMAAGGLLGMLVGGLFIICYLCRIDIFIYDNFMFAACFVFMMIVPGHVINKKARK